MRQEFTERHWVDESDNPAGGTSWGPGICISWQNGPLRTGAGTPEVCLRRKPNGAFVETLIAMCIGRLQFYQNSKFHCIENFNAIQSLKDALYELESRTKDRENRGVEGTHKI
jgi:hypothetical protein